MGAETAMEPHWLDAGEQAAWRGLLDLHARLTAQLNRELQETAGISLADFSVLVQLSECVDERMRVLELARALRWEKSRLSHQLTRMQQRSLVDRDNCAEDRRGAFVLLTAHGRRTIEAAAPQHVESVRRYLIDQVDAAQLAALREIASAVVTALEPAECEASCADATGAVDAGPDCDPNADDQGPLVPEPDR